MTITMNTTNSTSLWFKRIAAGAVLATGSAMVALGAAGAGHADTTGPNMSSPTPHTTFPPPAQPAGPGFLDPSSPPVESPSRLTSRAHHFKQFGCEKSSALLAPELSYREG